MRYGMVVILFILIKYWCIFDMIFVIMFIGVLNKILFDKIVIICIFISEFFILILV